MNNIVFFVLISLISFFQTAKAEVVEIPEEELSKETVLQKFDFPENVKNRSVVTDKKFEIGGYFGWNISEPIYGQGKMGANIGYHFSETVAIILNYAKLSSGLNTQYTDGLEKEHFLDFRRAPKLLDSTYFHYEWLLYYGKINFSKQMIANTTLYPIFGIGQTRYESRSYKGLDAGIGLKLYFQKNFGCRADFKLQYSESPSPFLSGRMRTSPLDPTPEPTEFHSRWTVNSILDFGFMFLL
mgnify:CR=1 FL=1